MNSHHTQTRLRIGQLLMTLVGVMQAHPALSASEDPISRHTLIKDRPVEIMFVIESTDANQFKSCGKAIKDAGITGNLVVTVTPSTGKWSYEFSETFQPPFKTADKFTNKILNLPCGASTRITYTPRQGYPLPR